MRVTQCGSIIIFYKIFSISTVILTSFLFFFSHKFSYLFASFNALLQMLILQELAVSNPPFSFQWKLLLHTPQKHMQCSTQRAGCVQILAMVGWQVLCLGQDSLWGLQAVKIVLKITTIQKHVTLLSNVDQILRHWNAVIERSFSPSFFENNVGKKPQTTTKATVLSSMKFHIINFQFTN